jgi:hypothetical protein
VIEDVSLNRVTLQWLLQRETRIRANKSWGRIRKFGWLPSLMLILLQVIANSVVAVLTLAAAALMVPFSRTKSKFLASKGLISFAAVYGFVLPIFGILPEPYREVDGH